MTKIKNKKNPIIKQDYSVFKRFGRLVGSIVYFVFGVFGISMITVEYIQVLQGKESDLDLPLVVYLIFLGLFALGTYLYLRLMIPKNWDSTSYHTRNEI